MNRPRICAVIVNDDPAAAREVEPLVDLFEVRIDLIGDGWSELAKQLTKPWIACNRRAEEGGSWRGSESKRIEELLKAIELGPDIIDIELATPDLPEIVRAVKTRAKCLISFHDFTGTPPPDTMRQIVQRQLQAGADIAKLITTAQKFADNLAVLHLIKEFSQARIVAFAMGPLGHTSRVLCPLAGGDFTYASIAAGRESAPGQITVAELSKIYGVLKDEH